MLNNVHVLYIYCRYLIGSERDREKQVMLGPVFRSHPYIQSRKKQSIL